MTLSRNIRQALAAIAIGFCGLCAAAPAWRIAVLQTRAMADGQPVTVPLAIASPPASEVRHIVLVPIGAATAVLSPDRSHVPAAGPWVLGAEAFARQGVLVAYLGAPSDAAGRALARRPVVEVRKDVQAAIDALHKQFSGVPLHLGLFGLPGAAIQPLLELRGVDKAIVVSGNFLDDRGTQLRSLPVLFVHPSSAQCDSAPLLEAEQVARNSAAPLVRVAYPAFEREPSCGPASQYALKAQEDVLAQVVTTWLAGAAVPAEVGASPAAPAWQEQLVHYGVPGALGALRLEMTLLLPPGRRPAPVVVFSHGDVDFDHPWMRYHRRVRNMVMAREFLKLGIAVAMPARRGVGLSEGTYPRGFQSLDADPTYKARAQAEDIVPAIAALRSRADIDGRRILLAGHSAGGYSSLYLAGQGLAGVIGVVDFSGGRTDMTATSAPSPLNRMMVDGFSEMGRTSKVPALFVFAEGDSRYTAQTIRASHEAFVSAGGRASLVMAPALGFDGHLVVDAPQYWRAALKDFLLPLDVIE